MKVKNISGEKLIEPYFGVVLEPGKVVDLQEPQLSRVLAMFGDRVQLIIEDKKTSRGGERKRGGSNEKTEEEVSEWMVTEENVVTETYSE